MQNKEDSIIKVIANVALFFLALGMLVALILWLAMSFPANTNEGIGVILSLLCGIPMTISLFVQLRLKEKSEWYKAFALPILIIPLLISLWLAWFAFQERPTNMFKDFVADPIPVGVSDIQSRNVTSGFDDVKIIIAFKSTPEAVDKLIADKALVQVQDSHSMDEGFKKFWNIDLKQNWTMYGQNYSTNVHSFKVITIWGNPERNLVLFQYWTN